MPAPPQAPGNTGSLQYKNANNIVSGATTFLWDIDNNRVKAPEYSINDSSVSIKASNISGLVTGEILSDDQAVTKGYVDTYLSGIVWKKPVDFVSKPSDQVLDSNWPPGGSNPAVTALDNTGIFDGDRVLFKDQVNPKQNGIYDVNNTTGWTRSPDLSNGVDAKALAVFVLGGETEEKFSFVCNTIGSSVTVGLANGSTNSDLTFVKFSKGEYLEAGPGLIKTGEDFRLVVDDSTLFVDINTLKVKSGGISSIHLTNLSVQEGKIANNAVTFGKIKNGAVYGDKILIGGVKNDRLENSSIGFISGDGTLSAGILTLGTGVAKIDLDTSVVRTDGRNSVTGNQNFTSLTNSTSSTTGAISLTSGGLGVKKDIWVDGKITVGGILTLGTLNLNQTGVITGVVTDSSDSTSAVSKSYVDNASLGIQWKDPVTVSSVSSLSSLSGLSPSGLDSGVTLTGGERVLVKNQIPNNLNGVYISSSGDWDRSLDFNSGSVKNFAVFVEKGEDNQTSAYVVSNNPITIGTDPMIFSLFNKSIDLTPGVGSAMNKIGNELFVKVDNSTMIITGDTLSVNSIGSGQIENDAVTNIQILDGTINQSKLLGSIPITKLTQNQFTVTPGTGLTGGGVADLGGSLTLNVDTSLFLSDSLANGTIFVGDVTNKPVSTTLSQDILITNSGVVTIQPGVITEDKIVDNAVTNNKILNSKLLLISSGGITFSTVTPGEVNLGETFEFGVDSTVLRNTGGTSNGIFNFASLENSSSSVTGAVRITGGGLGVKKDIYTETNIISTGIILKDSVDNSHSVTIKVPDITGDYAMLLPTSMGSTNQVLSVQNSGTGQLEWSTVASTSTFQSVYDDSTLPEVIINDTKDGLIIRDSSTPITGDIFSVTNNSKGTKFFNVTSSGINIKGTANISGNMTLNSTGAQTITHTAASGNLIIGSTNGDVVVDSVIFNTGAVSGITSLDASGIVSAGTFTDGTATMTGGVLTVNNVNTDSLASTGVVSAGTFTDGTATMSGGVLSGVTTANISGNMTLSSSGTQAITHTAASGNLNIVSTNGNVVVDSVTFNTGAVSGVSILTATTLSGTTVTDGTATMSGGDLSGVGSIGADSLTAVNAVEGGSITDGTATMTGGVLTANSINTGSLTATGALSGASITDGVSTMSGGSIINLTAPITNPLQAATKAYVDDNLQGFQYKDPVYASSTGNMTLTGLSPVGLDIGVTLAGGERVLVKDQDTSTENGVYISSSVAWGRATDFDSPNDVNNFAIFIENGETNANSSYVVTSDPAVIGSTDPIVFVQISGAGQIEAGAGLTKFGNNISVNVSGSNGVVVTGDVLNLSNTLVSPGTYGSSIGVSQVTVDQQGRVTSASNINIQNATTIQKGLLTSTDWNTFNSKLTSDLINSYIFVGSSGGQALAQPVTGDLTLDNLGEFTIKPTIPGNKTFSGAITVGSVTDGVALLTSGALSGVTTANIKGSITLSSASGQTITHTGSTGNLTISSTNGNVVVDSVTFNTGAVSGITSLSASGIVSAGTFSNGGATMNGGSLNNVVSIDTASLTATDTVSAVTFSNGGATFSGGDLSGVGSIGTTSLTATTVNGTTVTDGIATMSGGDLSGVGSIGAASLTASGIVTGGTVTDGLATITGGALSGVTTANISGNMTLSSSTAQSITHTAALGNLTISSTNGDVVVDSVTFNNGAVSGVTSLDASGVVSAGTFTDGTATIAGGVLTVNSINTGSLSASGEVSGVSITDGLATMTGGALSGVTTANISENMTLSSDTAQSITHTGSSGNLTIVSTNGNVVVDSVTFNSGAVSGVTSLGASGAVTAGSFVNGTATLSGGDLSGVGIIGATSLNATNVNGTTVTDGTATMTGGVLTANSINTGSLAASGEVSGASITNGTVLMSGGSITNLTTPITESLQAATKAYVDFKSQGLEYKDPVYASSIGAMTLTGLSPTGLDTGVTLVGGERVLVKDQGTSTENGVYISSSVAWGRSTDFGDSVDVNKFAVFIENGETNANSSYVVSSEPAFIGSTDPIEFSQISGAGQIDAGSGLTKTGSVLAVNVSGSNGVVVTGDVLNLSNTLVAPGTYGSSIGVSQITVDQQGRVTGAGTINIQDSTTIQKGLLTSTDWNTFNSKLTSDLINSYIFIGSSGGQAIAQPVTGDLTLDNLGEFTIKPTIPGNKTFSGDITVGSVTDGVALLTSGALSGVTTANIKGSITLSSASGQTITHTGSTGNLTIGSTNGNVVVESVTINTGVVSGVTSLSASGIVSAGTFSNEGATMTGGDLSGVGIIGTASLTATDTVSAVTFSNGGATMTGGDLSGVGSIGATSLTATTVNGTTVTDGIATMSGGDLSGVGSIGSASLTASGIVTGGTVTDGLATITGGALSGVTTANISGNMTLSSSTAQSITHTAALGNLTISSTNGDVVVDSVTFNNGAVSGVTSLDASGVVSAGTFTDGTATIAGGVLTVNSINTGSLSASGEVSGVSITDGLATMTGGALSGVTTSNISGNMTLSSDGAQSITHTGASGNLTISSTNGDVVVDSVTFNTGAVSGVTSLGASGAVTAGSFVNGTATLSGGDLSGVGIISTDSLSAVNAVTGGSITDGVATMSSGALTAVSSINTGSLAATGAVSGASITNGTVLMSGGSITNLTSPIIDSKQAATKAYVDQFSQGIKFKGSVNSSSVGPIDLTTGGLSPVGLDAGVTLVGGERVIVKDQSLGSEIDNGVYIASSGAWVRATDFGDGINVSNFAVFVENGTEQGGFSYIVISPDPANINTHDIIFGQLAGTENVIAGDGLTKTGSTLNVNVSGSNGIVVTGDVLNLSNTLVSPGTYGSSIGVSQVTVDQQGRVTSASTVNIQDATTTQKGLLTSTDWNTFNSKLTSGLTSGNIFIGNGNVATSTTMGGEGLLNSIGEFTLGALISGNKTFSGAITVGSVTDGVALLNGGALSGVTTANIKENITLSSASAQTITHTGASGNLTISSTNGNVVVDSVTFNTGVVSGVTSLSASGIVSAGTFSNGGATMTGGDLSGVGIIGTASLTATDTVSAVTFSNGGATFSGGDLSGVGSIGATSLTATTVNGTTVTDGIATMSGGDLSGVGSIGATSLTASGIVTGGTVTDGLATITGGALSGVTTANISGNMTLSSSTAQSITHTAALGNLTISSTNGDVVVDSVTFNNGAVSGVTSLDASGVVSAGTFTDGTATMAGGILTVNSINTGSLLASGEVSGISITDGLATMTGGALSGVTTANISGNMTLSSNGAQSITHTGASGNLTIGSTNGNVVVDSVTFNSGAVSGVTSLGASGAVTAGSFVNGTATLSGGDLSGVGIISTDSLSAVNAVTGGSITDGVATMSSGALTAVSSINTGSLAATGAVSGASITNGTVLMSGGSITNLTTPITESLQAATKAYVDFKSQGLEYKDPVYASSIGAMTLTGLSPTGLDTGVTLVGGERVLVKDQGTSTENGVYISSSVAWGRSTDFGDSVDVNKFAVFIENGETNANSSYVVSSEPAFIGSTDPIEFSQISGAGQIEAGDGLTKTGSVLAVNVSGSNGIVVTGDVLNIANTISGNKTFSGDITVGSVTDGTATISGGVLSGVTTANISGLLTTDLGIVINGTTSGSITLNVPSIINDYTVTLPDSVGETDSVLTTNSSGVTSWTKISKNYGYRLISVSETITSSDDVVAVDTSLGAVTITLPDIIGKQKFTIIDESGNADIENITISCDGTDTIIGQSSVVITDKYNSYTLFSDGISKWFIA